jgi:hypothetical protein
MECILCDCKYRFTLLASRAMGAIHVCVFVRHDILGAVSNVTTHFVPCGIGNVMHNKVTIIPFLSCHFCKIEDFGFALIVFVLRVE